MRHIETGLVCDCTLNASKNPPFQNEGYHDIDVKVVGTWLQSEPKSNYSLASVCVGGRWIRNYCKECARGLWFMKVIIASSKKDGRRSLERKSYVRRDEKQELPQYSSANKGKPVTDTFNL